jgi:uncharacterized protein (TIGR04255 family)
MNSMSQLTGNFEPIHDAHAIEQVQIVINFAQLLDEVLFGQVRQAMAIYKTDAELPGGSELQSIAIGFGQNPGFFVGAPGQISKGFLMQRIAPNGAIETEVRIEVNSITFRTTLYSRWNTVWGQFSKYLKSIVSMYAGNSPVMHVSLSFVDKFFWVGERATCQPKVLLRPNSRYLCPYIYDSPDLWHSHTGAFLPVDQFTKRLLNVNVDYLDEQMVDQPRRIINISTVLTDMLNQPGFKPHQLSPIEAFDKLQERLVQLHEQSKHFFSEVISDEMCKRIALLREK